MKLLILLCVLAFSSYTNADKKISYKNCGERPLAPVARIVSGKASVPGDWSWSVSMQQYGRHFCGGVLINEEYVLTAAHCFAGSSVTPPGMTIDIGIHNRNFKESWVQTRSVEKIFSHEKFNGNTIQNDITLIKLSKKVDIDDEYIIPACVDENDDLLSELDPRGKQAWLTGWGHERFGGSATIQKMQVNMTIFDDQKCRNKYFSMFDPNQQLCGGETWENSGACQGDSGGPLVLQNSVDKKWYIVGLISWGFGCGAGTVFAKVRGFMDWIRSKMD